MNYELLSLVSYLKGIKTLNEFELYFEINMFDSFKVSLFDGLPVTTVQVKFISRVIVHENMIHIVSEISEITS